MLDSWSVEDGSTEVRRDNPAGGARTLSRRRTLQGPAKRSLDILLALSAAVASSWLFIAIAIAIAVTTRGPILFRQRRTGLNGRVFTIYKFRTMTVAEDGDIVPHATRNDPRLTRIGAVLRRTSLDELPQVINSLRGDMSVVGPRPHAVAHDRHYGALIPRYGDRFRFRPGLTGLAQVQGLRGEIKRLECMARRIDADTEYNASWSLLGDLAIMARTVPLLLEQVNAH